MIFTVLSYNIHKGFNIFNARFTLHEIRRAIQATNADIAFLQEVVGEHQSWKKKVDSYPSESQFEFLADQMWSHHHYGKNAVFPERHHGNAILSKFPVLRSENLNLSLDEMEQRGIQLCEIEMPEHKQNLFLLNTHLNLLERDRNKQLTKIQAWIKTIPADAPLVLAGDFNDWLLNAVTFLRERAGLREAFQETLGRPPNTFPSFFPQLSLDRIFYRHLKIHSVEILKGAKWRWLSDHLPLLVRFEMVPRKSPDSSSASSRYEKPRRVETEG